MCLLREPAVHNYICSVVLLQIMAARPGQRPNGLPRDKICQYKLAVLGKKLIPHDLLLLCYVIIDIYHLYNDRLVEPAH